MIGVKRKESNYSIFLLALLLIEFISFFFRANSMPNLGVFVRVGILSFIVANFIFVALIQFINGYKNVKIITFAIVFWLYTLFAYAINNSWDLIEVLNLTSWVAVLYLFYYYGLPKSSKILHTLIVAFIIFYTVLYYRYALNSGYVGDKPGVVNSIYYIVLSLPFVILMKNRIVKNIILAVVALVVVVSQKGTAILIVVFTMLINYFFVRKMSKKNIIVAISGAITFVVVWLVIMNYSDVDLLSLLSDDLDSSGNGRFDIWTMIFERFNKGEIIDKVFGFGLNFSARTTGQSAHCDYIEVFSAFGFVGFALFMKWYYEVLKVVVVSRKKYSRASNVLLIIFVQASILMLFSTSIFLSNYFLLLMALLGMELNEIARQYNDAVEEKAFAGILK